MFWRTKFVVRKSLKFLNRGGVAFFGCRKVNASSHTDVFEVLCNNFVDAVSLERQEVTLDWVLDCCCSEGIWCLSLHSLFSGDELASESRNFRLLLQLDFGLSSFSKEIICGTGFERILSYVFISSEREEKVENVLEQTGGESRTFASFSLGFHYLTI